MNMLKKVYQNRKIKQQQIHTVKQQKHKKEMEKVEIKRLQKSKEAKKIIYRRLGKEEKRKNKKNFDEYLLFKKKFFVINKFSKKKRCKLFLLKKKFCFGAY